MSHFVYVEQTEGGMESYEFSGNNVPRLYGWMDATCLENDTALIYWLGKAQVGEYFPHRLGICFCVKEPTP